MNDGLEPDGEVGNAEFEDDVLGMLDDEDEFAGISSCDALMIIDGVAPPVTEEDRDDDSP